MCILVNELNDTKRIVIDIKNKVDAIHVKLDSMLPVLAELGGKFNNA
jgi:hypothetical protein